MTNTQKIVAVVIVAVLLGSGAWLAFGSPSGSALQGPYGPTAANAPQEQTTLPSGSDTSDAAMQQDLTSVDTQMGGFASDSASVQSGVDGQASGQAQ